MVINHAKKVNANVTNNRTTTNNENNDPNYFHTYSNHDINNHATNQTDIVRNNGFLNESTVHQVYFVDFALIKIFYKRTVRIVFGRFFLVAFK